MLKMRLILTLSICFIWSFGHELNQPLLKTAVNQKLLQLDLKLDLTVAQNVHPDFNLDSINQTRLLQCYDSTFGKIKLNIFKQTLVDVVYGYFEYTENLDAETKMTDEKIVNLVSNLKALVVKVLDCAAQTDNGPVNKLGLNSLFVLNQEDLTNLARPISRLPPRSEILQSSGANAAYKLYYNRTKPCNKIHNNFDRTLLPSRFDWRNYDVITPIRNQYHCGNCFMFASVAALESAYMLQLGKPKTSFSEQDYLNCYSAYGEGGCRGGWVDDFMDFVQHHGIVKIGQNGTKFTGWEHTCRNDFTPISEKLIDYCLYTDVADEYELMSIIYNFGPVVLSLNSFSLNTTHLKGPFFTGCGTGDARHVMLAVGWDEDFIIFKNSWGPLWGIDGYWYHARTEDNEKCNFKTVAAVPLFKYPVKSLGDMFTGK